MQIKTIAFIGAGNLASCIIHGLIRQGFPAEKIWVSNPNREKLQRLKEQLSINITSDNTTAVSAADVILLAVKPQVMSHVLNEINSVIDTTRHCLISLAAGVRINLIYQWLGQSVPCVRCMPNTPAIVGNGATGLYADTTANNEHKTFAESIMRSVGVTQWLNSEEELDIVTALSGSGPAYFFLFLESLEKAAVDEGLDAETAHLLTLQTALGATHLAMESDATLTQLREQVTSPGGTTESGLKVLEVGQMREVIAQALQQARQRAVELADLLAKNN